MQTMSKPGTTSAIIHARDARDPRWASVAAKDRAADGIFVYAVTSTGIYCRPSCPSRRPRPDRVRFFDEPSLAEQAGFRACRRCRPQDTAQADPWVEKIRRATVYLANVEGALNAVYVDGDYVGKALFMSLSEGQTSTSHCRGAACHDSGVLGRATCRSCRKAA